MDKEKIGKFIQQQRLKMNMTQKDLAEKLNTSRENLSKWERGIAVPNTEYLKEICEHLNISINELLAGELLNEENEEKINNVVFEVIDENAKKIKRIITIFTFLIFSIIILFLLAYFVNTYKSFKVYKISTDNDKYQINDSMLVMSNEKIYLSLNSIISYENKNITSIELFYKKHSDKEYSIIKTDNTSVIISDYTGYEEYIKKDDYKYLLNNLYAKIYYDNNIDIIKLDVTKDYINDSIMESKKEKNNLSDGRSIKSNESSLNIKESVLDYFNYDVPSNTYIYETKLNDKEIKISINLDEKWIIVVEKTKNDIERWNIIYNKKKVKYFKNNMLVIEYLEDGKCLGKMCENSSKLDYIYNNYIEKLVIR